MDNIEEFCKKYLRTGLYTHVYVACGLLESKENLKEYMWGLDQGIAFDLSSLTKALVTTPLAIWHCKEKSLTVDAKLKDLFPNQQIFKPEIMNLTMRQCLRHETGLPFWKNFYVFCDNQRQNFVEAINQCKLIVSKKDVYSDLGFILIGELLTNLHSSTLFEYWHQECDKRFLKGSRELKSGIEISKSEAISTGFCNIRKRSLIGEVHDENCWALGGVTGHAGLFGTGTAVVQYLKSLWNSQSGREVFNLNFAEKDSPGDSLLGWRKGKDYSSETFANGRGCGHMGFTGTAFWIDPKTKSYAVVLTNRVISGRITPEIKEFRRGIMTELSSMVENSI